MISEHQEEIARKQFQLAAKEFGFVFHSPVALTDTISAFGYIENYGSKNGIVISLTAPPDFATDPNIVDWCKETNCFYSFVNIEPLLGKYNASYFRGMLRDWRKY